MGDINTNGNNANYDQIKINQAKYQASKDFDSYEKNFSEKILNSSMDLSSLFNSEYFWKTCRFIRSVHKPDMNTIIPPKYSEGSKDWFTIYSSDNWRIQVRYGDWRKYRILSPNDNVRAQGSSKRILRPFVERYLEVQKIDHLDSEERKKIAIVFSGGGAKGAYQVGVMKWLEENHFTDYITGVSGASVGALNSLLFLMQDSTLAEKVWSNIKSQDITPTEDLIKLVISASMKFVTGFNPMDFIFSGVDFDDLGLFTQDRLREIIDKYVAIDNILEKDMLVYTSLSALSWPNIKKPTKLIKKRSYFAKDYRCWQALFNHPREQIKNVVLASAAIPAVYAPQKVSGIVYVDGGVVDNNPYRPLTDAGFKDIILVHLKQTANWKNGNYVKHIFLNTGVQIDKKDSECRVYHLVPSRDLGKTLEVSHSLTKKRIELGYQDAKEQLDCDFLRRIID